MSNKVHGHHLYEGMWSTPQESYWVGLIDSPRQSSSTYPVIASEAGWFPSASSASHYFSASTYSLTHLVLLQSYCVLHPSAVLILKLMLGAHKRKIHKD